MRVVQILTLVAYLCVMAACLATAANSSDSLLSSKKQALGAELNEALARMEAMIKNKSATNNTFHVVVHPQEGKSEEEKEEENARIENEAAEAGADDEDEEEEGDSSSKTIDGSFNAFDTVNKVRASHQFNTKHTSYAFAALRQDYFENDARKYFNAATQALKNTEAFTMDWSKDFVPSWALMKDFHYKNFKLKNHSISFPAHNQTKYTYQFDVEADAKVHSPSDLLATTTECPTSFKIRDVNLNVLANYNTHHGQIRPQDLTGALDQDHDGQVAAGHSSKSTVCKAFNFAEPHLANLSQGMVTYALRNSGPFLAQPLSDVAKISGGNHINSLYFANLQRPKGTPDHYGVWARIDLLRRDSPTTLSRNATLNRNALPCGGGCSGEERQQPQQLQQDDPPPNPAPTPGETQSPTIEPPYPPLLASTPEPEPTVPGYNAPESEIPKTNKPRNPFKTPSQISYYVPHNFTNKVEIYANEQNAASFGKAVISQYGRRFHYTFSPKASSTKSIRAVAPSVYERCRDCPIEVRLDVSKTPTFHFLKEKPLLNFQNLAVKVMGHSKNTTTTLLHVRVDASVLAHSISQGADRLLWKLGIKSVTLRDNLTPSVSEQTAHNIINDLVPAFNQYFDGLSIDGNIHRMQGASGKEVFVLGYDYDNNS